MSLFSVGGNAGFALGPALVTPAPLALGLHGALAVGTVPILTGLVIAAQVPHLRGFRPEGLTRSGSASTSDDQRGPLTRLGVVAARSIVYFGWMTFVALYFIRKLGRSKAEGNTALTIMLAAGALGTLIGGQLAER